MTEGGQRLAEEDEEGPQAASPGEGGVWTQASPRWATSDSRAAVVDSLPGRQGP